MRPFDIIAIQDPPPSFLWLSSSIRYNISYHTTQELSQDATMEEVKKKKLLSPVCFLVHQSIDLSRWRVQYYEHLNNLAATLTLETASGSVRIHNIYNRDKQIPIDALLKTCASSDADLLLGDFNLPHRRWGGERAITTQFETATARQLSDGTMHMKCLTPVGAITYSRGVQDWREQYCSTVDLTFAGSAIAGRAVNCEVLGPEVVRGFESDHRIVRTTLDMTPYCAIHVQRRMWQSKQWSRAKYFKTLSHLLKRLDFRPVKTKSQVDSYIFELTMALWVAERKHVPMARHDPRYRTADGNPSEHDDLLRAEAETLRTYQKRPIARQLKRWEECQAATDKYEAKLRARSFRQFLSRKTSRAQGIYRLNKMSQRWVKPKGLPHMPPFLLNGVTYSRGEDQARLFREAVWPAVSDTEQPDHLELPYMDPHRPQHHSPQKLEDGEILKILPHLPKGKAAGPDKITTDCLKLSRAVLAPYLEYCFQACLDLCYHPKAFGHATTIVLRKADKTTYTVPGSWRPIALLSCLGKVYEKLLANRLTKLVLEHNLLPAFQFGAPGKSTTQALEHLLDGVYSGFHRDAHTQLRGTRKVSLLSLDISGAFDRVVQYHQLSILIEKGIPTWLVIVFWSFLSHRSTLLVLPGYTSAKFWLHVSLPQGSPLSLLLFGLYAAKPVEAIDVSKWGASVSIILIAFVDDTYIMVSSNAYEVNCKVIEDLHLQLVRAASRVGMKFSPHKYGLMHFVRPGTRAPMPTCIPNIDGVVPSELLKGVSMRVLGVWLDPKLSWGQHFIYIEKRVNNFLRGFYGISHCSGGTPTLGLRQIYLTCVRPMIAYGCPAWYHTGPSPWAIRDSLIAKLEKLEMQCLRRVAGVQKNVGPILIRHELGVEQISQVLLRLSTNHRAMNLDSDLGKSILAKAYSIEDWDLHPYRFSYVMAKGVLQEAEARSLASDVRKKKEPDKALAWDKRAKSKAIRAITVLGTEELSKCAWTAYQAQKGCQPQAVPYALQYSWTPKMYEIYRGLSRAQGTMLMRSRVGALALRATLYSYNYAGCTYADSPLCPRCVAHPETLQHLLLYCPGLRVERTQLIDELGHSDLNVMLTRDAKIMRWAILHFDVASFRDAKEDYLMDDRL